MSHWPLWMLVIYFLPSLIAGGRHHHNALAIFAVNILLGWSVIGWIVAFVWSLTAVRKKDTNYIDDLKNIVAKIKGRKNQPKRITHISDTDKALFESQNYTQRTDSQSTQNNVEERIEKLHDLLTKKAITQDEYEARKKQILNS